MEPDEETYKDKILAACADIERGHYESALANVVEAKEASYSVRATHDAEVLKSMLVNSSKGIEGQAEFLRACYGNDNGNGSN